MCICSASCCNFRFHPFTAKFESTKKMCGFSWFTNSPNSLPFAPLFRQLAVPRTHFDVGRLEEREMFNTPHYGASPASLGHDVDSFARRISLEDGLATEHNDGIHDAEGRSRRLSSSYSNSGRLSPSLERRDSEAQAEAEEDEEANRTTIIYHPSPSISVENLHDRNPFASENTPLLPSIAPGKEHDVAREELRILLGCTYSFCARGGKRNRLILAPLQTLCRLRVPTSWK